MATLLDINIVPDQSDMIPAIARRAWRDLTCSWCRVKAEEAPSELNVFVHGESQVKAPKADMFNQKIHSIAMYGPLLKGIFQLCIQMAVIMYCVYERGFWFSVNLHHTRNYTVERNPSEVQDVRFEEL